MGRKKLNKDKIIVTLPAGMAEELLTIANEEGRNRSDLIAELANEFLRKRAQKQKGTRQT